MEAEFQEAVLELKREGATVLLSSHILAEAEALCRPDQHHPRRPGRAERLARRAAAPDAHDGHRRDRGAGRRIGEVEGVHNPQFLDGRVTFDVDSDHLDAAVRVLAALGVRSLAAHPPTLEELFLRQYGEEVTRVSSSVHRHPPPGPPRSCAGTGCGCRCGWSAWAG